MEGSCGGRLALEVAVLLLVGLATLPQVAARRIGAGGSGGSDDPVQVALNSSTISGHRGEAGTLGILTAAAFVIPAGVVSVLYLIYVHNCQGPGSADHDEEKYSRTMLDWGDPGAGDMADMGRLYAADSGSLSADEDDVEEKVLMSSPLLQAASEPHHETACLAKPRVTHSGEGNGDPVSSGPRLITPERETPTETTDNNNEDAKRPGENGGCVNAVEVLVGYRGAVSPRAGAASGARQKTPSETFKQAVNMQVVKEVHVEIRLTSEQGGNYYGPGADGGGEIYTSEVQMFLPGLVGNETGSSGRDVKSYTGLL